MDEGRKRLLAIVAGILMARHLKTPEDLGNSRPSPRTEISVMRRRISMSFAERETERVYRLRSQLFDVVGMALGTLHLVLIDRKPADCAPLNAHGLILRGPPPVAEVEPTSRLVQRVLRDSRHRMNTPMPSMRMFAPMSSGGIVQCFTTAISTHSTGTVSKMNAQITLTFELPAISHFIFKITPPFYPRRRRRGNGRQARYVAKAPTAPIAPNRSPSGLTPPSDATAPIAIIAKKPPS